MTTFTDKVLNIVKKIKKGQTMSYGEVARRAGNPGASRAVGSIMKKNYDNTIPCHRVVKSNREIGEYNRGKIEKMRKLKEEGVNLL